MTLQQRHGKSIARDGLDVITDHEPQQKNELLTTSNNLKQKLVSCYTLREMIVCLLLHKYTEASQLLLTKH